MTFFKYPYGNVLIQSWLIDGGQGGLVVIYRASHHCEPGFNSGLGLSQHRAEFQSISTCLEGFSPGTPVFIPHQNRLTAD